MRNEEITDEELSRHHRGQDDVPVERLIHYIVKDYRRMYLDYDELRARVRRAELKVQEKRIMRFGWLMSVCKSK